MTDPDVAQHIGEIIPPWPADYDRLVEYRRERERIRKREARKRQTPEHRERERIRKQEERKRQTSEQREREAERSRNRTRKKIRPFMAIDGEGGGTDELGRQNYLLMMASGPMAGGEHLLHRDGKPLSVRDCLEFLLSLPAEPILVGYGIGYDATQILRGIMPLRAAPHLKSAPGEKWRVLHVLGRLRHHLSAGAISSRSSDRPQRSDPDCDQGVVPNRIRNSGFFPMHVRQGD